VFSFFKIYPVFSASNVALKYKQYYIQNRVPVPFTQYCSSDFESDMQMVIDAQAQNGFTLAYNWDTNDGYYSDRVKDLSDKNIVATVAQRSDLDTLSIGRGFTTDDIALVANENLYYQVADATSSPIKWDCFAEKLDNYISGGGEGNTDLGLSTLCQYAELNSSTGLYERQEYVGTRQTGCYINNKNIRVNNPFALRLFYIKKIFIGTNNVPVSFNHNTRPDGSAIEPYTLALTSGFAAAWHLSWEKLKGKLETIKVQLASDKKALSLYTAADCLEINSIHFIPYKTERSIPASEKFDAYLVPL
jgi:hypothetical protein